MSLKTFVRIAVIVSVLACAIMLVARTSAQEGVNAGEGMPQAKLPDNPQTAEPPADEETLEVKPAPTVSVVEKPTVSVALTPGTSDKPLHVVMIDGRPRAADSQGRVVIVKRSGGGCRRSEAWHRDISRYRNGKTKDQSVQWNAISTAQATANRAEAKTEDLNRRVSGLEGKWWISLLGLIGLAGLFGLWRRAAAVPGPGPYRP